MRIGSRIKTWWQKKSTKYAAAGTLLLALSGAALALGVGSGARAAEVTLGDQIIDLNTDEDGAYLIEDEADLEALRTASADQTNHTFRLASDLTVSSITTAATGTFAGKFDGAGHVITIENINISDSTSGEVSHGILFGTVDANAAVYDLIINITDADASYTRTSKVEHGEGVSGTPSEIPTGDTPQPTVESGEFSILSEADEAVVKAKEFDNSSDETYYITANGSVTTDPNEASDSDVYVREEINQDMVKTTTYELGEAGDDAFGVLCGTLETDAEISQVMVTGSGTLNIAQNASEVSYQTTKNGNRNQYFYYRRTEGIELAGENVTASGTGNVTVYTTEEDTAEGNDEVLKVTVSARQYVAHGNDLKYNVTVENISDSTVNNIRLSVTGISDGTWNDLTPGFNLNSDEDKDFTYTVPNVSGNSYNAAFTASYDQSVTHSASATSTIVKDVTASGQDDVSNTIEISATAPAAVESENALVYAVTVSSLNSSSINGVTLSAIQSGGRWFSDESCNTPVNNTNNLTIPESGTTYYYQITNVTSDQNRNFSVSYQQGQGNAITASTGNLTTSVQENLETNVIVYDEENTVSLAIDESDKDSNRVIYKVVVGNLSDQQITGLKLSAGKDGIWSNGDDQSSASLYNNFNLNIGGSATFYYTVNSAGNTVSTDFTVEYIETSSHSVQTNPGLSTTVIFNENGISETGASSDGSFQWTLTTEKSNYFVGESITYKLILKNNWSPTSDSLQTDKEISIPPFTGSISEGQGSSGGTVSWSDDEGQFNGDVLSFREQIELTGIYSVSGNINNFQTISLSLNVTGTSTDIYENTYGYEYVSYAEMGLTDSSGQYSKTNYDGPEVESQTATAASGNNLYTGVIAGISSGSITEVKQDLSLSGSVGTASENDALLAVGGIMGQGRSGAQVSDLYVIGTPSAAGNADHTGRSGTVAASTESGASITLSDSLILATGSTGVTSGSGVYYNTNQGRQLAGEETKWKIFNRYTTGGSTEDVLELSWLVADTEFTSEFNTGTSTLTIAVPQDSLKRSGELEYTIAYEARKSMAEALDPMLYVADSAEIDLESSGYYERLNLYATDGFFHYTQEIEDPQRVYPYNTDTSQNPYDSPTWSVERLDDGSDVIQLTFSEGSSGSVYYLTSEGIPTEGNSEPAELQEQTVQLPFDTATVQYWLTPMIDGYIYPTIQSKLYGADDRKALPLPNVTISSAYNADGTEADYTELTENASYESGSRLKAGFDESLTAMNDCTFRYLFSETPPSVGSWEDNRYIGDDISSVMSGSSEYNGEMVLPDYDETTTIYLYLQVSKTNYNDELYCYGPITAGPRTQISAQALIPETGTVLGEGATVVPGDVLSLGSNRDGVTLQYEIRSSESESHTWSDYNEADKPQLAASGSTVYVYTRARYSDSSYSAVAEYTFTAGDSCDGIRISPNTGSSTEEGTPPDAGGAYSIDAGEVVNLSSQTSGARIIYLASGGSYAPFTIERVTDASLVSGMKDGGVSDGYTYFQNGSRWYRVSSDEVTVYDEADGAVIRNEESDAQLVYVYAVNLMVDMEPGAVTTYVYNVNPQQQVSAPEAALSTYYLPGGEDLERTEIDMGASLSFSSATQGAELYYSIGNSTGVPDTLYDPSTGIIVEGSYSETFTVRVMAVRDGMLDSEIRTFVYNIADKDAADAPTSVPTTSSASPAQVVPGEKILLSTLTRGASIYYTTDGTSPQLEELEDGSFQIVEGSSTMLYDATQGIVMPEGSSGYFTITAVAARTGLALSSEVHLTFAYPGDVMAPYASVSSGSVSASTSVVLRNRTEDAVIYYTVAYGGEEPADPTVSSPVFDESQPFVITQTTTIKAIAVKDGVISEVAEFTYTLMDTLGAPTASIESGTVVSRGTVLHLSAASGATIYYTMDGSDPTDLSNTAVVQGDSLTLNGAAGEQITIMAVARQEGKSDSDVATFTYQFSANTGGVTADVPTGSSVSNGSKVNLMTDVTGATIYYTTDGSSPDDSGIEGSTVTIQGTPGSTFTIKAVARVDGVSGTVVSFMYRIKEVPNAPTASPSGGTLTIATRVILSSNGDHIYYTTDGTTPTESSSLYTEPILIDRTTNLRAIAVSADGEVSEVSSFQYTAASKAAAPTASREDGAVLDPGTVVSLYTDTADAVIYYSTDGTEPTLDNMESLLEYTEEGIAVNRTVTVKAVAYREDLQLSDVSEFYYEVDTIPAVEMKQAEAERLAEEGLHDTDASGLARRVNASDTAGMRQLEEEEYYTVASFARDAAPDNVRLVTEVMDYSNAELDNVKLLYGDDYTILASYDIRLMSGSTAVRPDGDTEIGIPIPEGYENAAVIIASIDGNNAVTPLETRREDGMVYAYMTDQNHYVLIGLEHPDGAGSGFNYLLILEVAAGVTAAAGIAYYISRKVKKYRKNR